MAKKRKRRDVFVGESSYPSPELAALLAAGAFPRARSAARRPALRALEAGCGIASDALLLARRGFRVSAIDSDPKQITSARRRAKAQGLRLDARVADATRLPFGDGVFALVTDRLLWNNLLDDGKLRAYLDELARVTRPRGIVLVRAKSNGWWTVSQSFESPSRAELLGTLQWPRLLRDFDIPGPPTRTLILDPFGGLVPAAVMVLVRRGQT